MQHSQLFAGELAAAAPRPLLESVRLSASRFQAARSEAERLLQRALFLELALRASGILSAGLHPRSTQGPAFDPTALVVTVWRENLAADPRTLLVEWSNRTLAHLENDHNRLHHIEQWLLANCSSRITCAEVSERFGVSTANVNRLFHKYFGVSVSEYHRGLRLLKALEMIIAAEKIDSIPKTLGYGGRGNFFTAFKKWFRTTPLQFRKDRFRLPSYDGIPATFRPRLRALLQDEQEFPKTLSYP